MDAGDEVVVKAKKVRHNISIFFWITSLAASVHTVYWLAQVQQVQVQLQDVPNHSGLKLSKLNSEVMEQEVLPPELSSSACLYVMDENHRLIDVSCLSLFWQQMPLFLQPLYAQYCVFLLLFLKSK